jgi:hypothetical protein
MAKVTIGGLRRIIREELEKVIRENEDDFGSDEETDALIGTRVEIDEDGYISPYGADFGPTKFGPSMMFEPGDEVELVSFDESGSGAWVVRGPDGEEETLKATMGGGSNKGMSFDNNHFEFSRQRLATECPAAEAALDGMDNLGHEIDHNDTFWFIESKPRMISDGSDDGEYGREQWSGTNEPELASMLADGWDSISCNGKVYLCGTNDDEYGYYWDNGDQEWVSYNF